VRSRNVLFVLAFLLMSGTSFADTATKPVCGGRIDIYSENMGFGLKSVTSNGLVQPADWLPKNKQGGYWLAQMEIRDKEWHYLWIDFVPDISGVIYIALRGSLYPADKSSLHEVFVDDVVIEREKSAKILEDSFEQLDSTGNPAGWGTPAAKNSQVSSVSRTGELSMIVWHDSPLIRKIEVKGGLHYKVGAWFKSYRKL